VRRVHLEMLDALRMRALLPCHLSIMHRGTLPWQQIKPSV
jgi:hypothetical protein